MVASARKLFAGLRRFLPSHLSVRSRAFASGGMCPPFVRTGRWDRRACGRRFLRPRAGATELTAAMLTTDERVGPTGHMRDRNRHISDIGRRMGCVYRQSTRLWSRKREARFVGVRNAVRVFVSLP
jgi:hypothetical protein